MPHRADLYDRISTHIWNGFKNPIDRITEVLLWRGFLVEKRANDILLCTGSHDDDLVFLSEILPEPRFHIQEILNDVNHRATISVPKKITNRDILHIVSLGQQPGHGMLGEPLVGVDWLAFQNCRFGASVAVRWLDIGIALMVKTLPLAGVFTTYSCDGFAHGDRNTLISLHGSYHFGWCKRVIEKVTCELEIVNLGNFIYEPGSGWTHEYRWQIADTGFDGQIEEAFDVFHEIQCVARHLMRPEVIDGLRALKRKMKRDDLADCGHQKYKMNRDDLSPRQNPQSPNNTNLQSSQKALREKLSGIMTKPI
jgi:hypothetical protein